MAQDHFYKIYSASRGLKNIKNAPQPPIQLQLALWIFGMLEMGLLYPPPEDAGEDVNLCRVVEVQPEAIKACECQPQ